MLWCVASRPQRQTATHVERGLHRCTGCLSFGCLACHTASSLLFALIGSLVLLLLPPVERQELINNFASTKAIAFVTAIAPLTVLYAVFRCCEDRGRKRGEVVDMALAAKAAALL